MTTTDQAATNVWVHAPTTTLGRRVHTETATRPRWQCLACWILTLSVTLLGVTPAMAQDEAGALGDQRFSLSELPGSGGGGAAALTKETSLARTVRLLRSAGPYPLQGPGLDLAWNASTRAGLAQGGTTAVQGSDGGGLPWWAWALIGAGVAAAAMQLEFGDETDESEDD